MKKRIINLILTGLLINLFTMPVHAEVTLEFDDWYLTPNEDIYEDLIINDGSGQYEFTPIGRAIVEEDDSDFGRDENAAYNGLFKCGDRYLNIALYTECMNDEPCGIIYEIAKPHWGSNGYVQTDIQEHVGELMRNESTGKYTIVDKERKVQGSILFLSKEICISDTKEYDGTYEQISNAGPNMRQSDIWLLEE